MASTYSALKIELIATGEQSGTWGATTDTNLDVALGEAITGSATVNFATAADVTVTLVDTNTAQTARNLRLNITESSTGVGYVGNLILGSGCQINKLYLINNATTAVKTIKNTTGTGIAVPAGKSMFVFNNGTNVVDAVTYLTSITTPSATISGGTINSTVIGGTTPAAGTFTALSSTSGTLNGTSIGDTTASTGAFTNFTANGTASFTSTGAVKAPAGTTGQRPSPTTGMIRYNSTNSQFEGYFSSAWGSLGGGATGGGSNQVFVENDQTVTVDYTITTNKNAMSAGPITIDTGITVTVPTNSTWVIV
jgi:hypothetical protein